MQVIKTRITVLGPDHPDTLPSITNMAFAYKSLGQTEDALFLIKMTFQLRKLHLGPDHPDTQSALNLLIEWETGNLEMVN